MDYNPKQECVAEDPKESVPESLDRLAIAIGSIEDLVFSGPQVTETQKQPNPIGKVGQLIDTLNAFENRLSRVRRELSKLN